MPLQDAHVEHTKPPGYVSAGWFVYREAVHPVAGLSLEAAAAA